MPHSRACFQWYIIIIAAIYHFFLSDLLVLIEFFDTCPLVVVKVINLAYILEINLLAG